MTTGKHLSTTDTPSRWRRRILGVPVFGWAFMALGGVAFGVLGYIVLLGSSGTLATAPGVNVSYTVNGPTATAINGTPTCTATYVSPSEFNFSASNVLPGDTCRYRVEMANTGLADAYLNGFRLESAAFAGGDVTAAVLNASNAPACGAILTAETGLSFFAVDLTFGPDIDPSQTFTLQPSLDGFDWRVASEYNAAECS